MPLLTALLALASLSAAQPASQKLVAVLEFSNGAGLSTFEAEALADDVRGAALVLTRQGYLIMTRESMLMMLPPGTDLAQCDGGQCEVEAGRRVGADLVVSGLIGRFAGLLQVRLKLFDTHNGALLAQQTAQGKDLLTLQAGVRAAAAKMFAAATGMTIPADSAGLPAEVAPGSTAPGAPLATPAGAYFVDLLFNPEGSDVYVDGQRVGATPLRSHKLQAGRYSLKVTHADCLDHVQKLEVRGDMELKGALQENPRVQERLRAEAEWRQHKLDEQQQERAEESQRMYRTDWARVSVLATGGGLGGKASLFGLKWDGFYLIPLVAGLCLFDNNGGELFAGMELGYLLVKGDHYFSIGALLGAETSKVSNGAGVRPTLRYRYYWGRVGLEVSAEIPMVLSSPQYVFPPVLGIGVGM